MSEPRQSRSDSVAAKAVDDSFQLYDLRVEVICPPGARILCGAKPGDFFTLQGEMLHLPPDQGFSIYSLGELLLQLQLPRRSGKKGVFVLSIIRVECQGSITDSTHLLNLRL